MLVACQGSGSGLVKPQLPVIPANLAVACRDPGVTAGRPVLSEFARNRQSLAECRRKHRDLVAYYNDLRARLK
jgi:hypothetical protein